MAFFVLHYSSERGNFSDEKLRHQGPRAGNRPTSPIVNNFTLDKQGIVCYI